MISHQYAKTNNEKCPNYDSSRPKSCVLYEYIYSEVIMQYLLIGILGKISPKKIPNTQSITLDVE